MDLTPTNHHNLPSFFKEQIVQKIAITVFYIDQGQNYVELKWPKNNCVMTFQLSSPYGAFRLENSDVHFLHTFRPKSKPGSGWISKENFQEAYVEDCVVTNLSPLAENGDVEDRELVRTCWIVFRAIGISRKNFSHRCVFPRVSFCLCYLAFWNLRNKLTQIFPVTFERLYDGVLFWGPLALVTQ